MSRKTPALVLIAAATLAVLAGPTSAADLEVRRPSDTQTVAVKVRGLDELTEKINATHVEMAAKGFQLAGMVPYTEHGSLVGVLLTYVRQ